MRPTFTRGNKKVEEVKKIDEDDFIQRRVLINNIVIDTPALLNMIKHCQDSKELLTTGAKTAGGVEFQNGIGEAKGEIMGVLKKEIDKFNIFITQT